MTNSDAAERGDAHDHRRHPGRDEQPERIERDPAQALELPVDLEHRELGRVPRAEAAGHHQPEQERAELPDHRVARGPAEHRAGPEPLGVERGLDDHRRPGHRADAEGERERAGPEVHERADELAALEPGQVEQGAAEHEPERAEPGEHVQRGAAERGDHAASSPRAARVGGLTRAPRRDRAARGSGAPSWIILPAESHTQRGSVEPLGRLRGGDDQGPTGGESLEERGDPRGGLRVEARERVVAEQHLGPGDERAGEAGPLLHASREVLGPREQGRAEADLGERLGGARLRLVRPGPRGAGAGGARSRARSSSRTARRSGTPSRAGPGGRRAPPRRGRGRRRPSQAHRALPRHHQPGQRLEQRRLPRARRAPEVDASAGRKRGRHPREREVTAPVHREVVRGEVHESVDSVRIDGPVNSRLVPVDALAGVARRPDVRRVGESNRAQRAGRASVCCTQPTVTVPPLGVTRHPPDRCR